MKQALLSIFKAGVQSARPSSSILRSLQLCRDIKKEYPADCGSFQLLEAQGSAHSPARVIDRVELPELKKVLVLASGKAALEMCSAVTRVLAEVSEMRRSTPFAGSPMDVSIEGICCTKTGSATRIEDTSVAKLKSEGIKVLESDHPVPSDLSVVAGQTFLETARATDANLAIVCISGGSSSLLFAPMDGLSLDDVRRTSQALLDSGASIDEINAIRSQLCQVKQGGLLRALEASKCTRVWTLILSDVIGDDPAIIGSGPTVSPRDPSNVARRALETVAKYNLERKLPASVTRRLRASESAAGTDHDQGTPSPDSAAAALNHHTLVIGSNRIAVQACAAAASHLGIRPVVLSDRLQGEAKDVARTLAALAKACAASGTREHAEDTNRDSNIAGSESADLCMSVARGPCLLIAGGETTVTFNESYELSSLRDGGEAMIKADTSGDEVDAATATPGPMGGRAQEMAAAAALELAGTESVVFMAGGTDGTDGPTDATGGIVDGLSVERAASVSNGHPDGDVHMALQLHRSYHWLKFAWGKDMPEDEDEDEDKLSPSRPRGLSVTCSESRSESARPATGTVDQVEVEVEVEVEGGLVRTGPTGTNVMDLYLALVGPLPRELHR